MAVVVELVGTHCAGKTTIARLLAGRGFEPVYLDANVCGGGSPYARQRCIAIRFSRAYEEVEKLVARGKNVVMDNSLLSVAAYNILYGVKNPMAPAAMWADHVDRISRRYGARWLLVLVTADCETLRKRCIERGRPNSRWEAETTCHVDEILKQDVLALPRPVSCTPKIAVDTATCYFLLNYAIRCKITPTLRWKRVILAIFF